MVWEIIGSTDTNEKASLAYSNAIVRGYAMAHVFWRQLITSSWLKHKPSIPTVILF